MGEIWAPGCAPGAGTWRRGWSPGPLIQSRLSVPTEAWPAVALCGGPLLPPILRSEHQEWGVGGSCVCCLTADNTPAQEGKLEAPFPPLPRALAWPFWGTLTTPFTPGPCLGGGMRVVWSKAGVFRGPGRRIQGRRRAKGPRPRATTVPGVRSHRLWALLEQQGGQPELFTCRLPSLLCPGCSSPACVCVGGGAHGGAVTGSRCWLPRLGRGRMVVEKRAQQRRSLPS